MSSIIEDIDITKILDSRGNPTVEVDVITENGFGSAAAPSGASTGAREVTAFPEDGIDNIINDFSSRITPELVGIDAQDTNLIETILKELDGTDNISSLGGNIIVAISLATAKAAASSYNMPLYRFL